MRGLIIVLVIGLVSFCGANLRGDDPKVAPAEIAKQLRELDGRVIVVGTVRQPPLAGMLVRDAEAKLRIANRADAKAWSEVKSKADWEAFREKRLAALKGSLGSWPEKPKDFAAKVVGRSEGDGYVVENLVYPSRFGLHVAANLYRPAKPAASMPAILICQSHQSTKHSGSRQDMGMTWARAGCLVLVPDHLGHGERKQHPFANDAPHEYHQRYDLGLQFELIGESLMGQFAWDLMRGVDALLAQPGVDSKRMILISEPAGGGDVAAVTAALDPRITCAMIQNFGGPQPENAYPLAKDAEESFNYFGGGSWESTRNLRGSARDGFAPWFIVASIAPRRVIYFHEFYWDREQDPVWKRLSKVFEFYGAADSLAGMGGRGFVVGSAPENTHWLAENRELLYPLLEKWYSIPNPKKEYSQRRPEKDLLCFTPEVAKELEIRPAHVLLAKEVRARRSMPERFSLGRPNRGERKRLPHDGIPSESIEQGLPNPRQTMRGFAVERIHLLTEPGIVVPVVLLLPERKDKEKPPLVIGVAQQGKQAFLRERADEIALLLAEGIAVALPDVRGTGETSPGDDRDRRSAATSISSSHWMLDDVLFAHQGDDLDRVKQHLSRRPDIDVHRVAIWGDSFAKVNPPETNFTVPHTAANRPTQAEPLGELLALFMGVMNNGNVRAIAIRGGLSDYRSALDAPYVYLPHDAIVPRMLAIGEDLADTAKVFLTVPCRVERLVDAQNRLLSQEEAERRWKPVSEAYEGKNGKDKFELVQSPERSDSIATWLRDQLKAEKK